jgi:hypothetical protein
MSISANLKLGQLCGRAGYAPFSAAAPATPEAAAEAFGYDGSVTEAFGYEAPEYPSYPGTIQNFGSSGAGAVTPRGGGKSKKRSSAKSLRKRRKPYNSKSNKKNIKIKSTRRRRRTHRRARRRSRSSSASVRSHTGWRDS